MTVSLLSAVIIASSCTTSAANADAYFLNMQAYLNDIKRLFPVYKLRPNHHMALHLHEYLRLLGPVHAWWTFPFERVIGMLQQTPHRYHKNLIYFRTAQKLNRQQARWSLYLSKFDAQLV